MNLIENIRVSSECAEAGLGAKINHPAAIFDARKIGRVRVAEDPPAERDETRVLCWS